jgi:hypothetical protein
MGGGQIDAYDRVADTWAEMVPVGNALFFGSMQIADSVTHSFKVRVHACAGISRHAIGGDHVIECKSDGIWYRYRVKRCDELINERHNLLIQTELLYALEACDGEGG